MASRIGFGDVMHQVRRGDFFRAQPGVALFQAGEVQQVVKNAQEPFGIFARGDEQFVLPPRERAHGFFEQQMQRPCARSSAASGFRG